MTQIAAARALHRARPDGWPRAVSEAGASEPAGHRLGTASPDPSQRFAGPFATADSDYIERLRSRLDEKGFSETGVRAALGTVSSSLQLKRIDLPLYERRLATAHPLHTLIKLFLMRLWVNGAAAAAALEPLSIDGLVALGLLERGARGVHCTCSLSLCNGFIIAHDSVEQETTDPETDHVLGVNPSAVTLANLTVRRSVRLTLDLGTGSGIQALFASRHSDRVIATDINERALNYLVFNARLNRVANIECRRGHLFDPVKDLRFDLIVCNPPYVISPDSQYTFRDSGLPGDRVCEQIVAQAPLHLEPGGYATILCNWANRKGESWSEPVRRWASPDGCDTWVLRGATDDPLSYAAQWVRSPDRERYADALDRWSNYYARSGIDALNGGAVILRRREDGAPGWFRADDWREKLSENCSDQIVRVFGGESHSRAHTDAALLDQTFVLAPEHGLRQQLVVEKGDLRCTTSQLSLQQGLGFKCNLDPQSVFLLVSCDAGRTVREAIQQLSRRMGAPVEQIESQAIAAMRHLVAYGFLVPLSVGVSLESATGNTITAPPPQPGAGGS